MVGRAAEKDAVTAALDRLRAGEGGLLEVLGEPGMGKTRLLGELRRQAAARGLPALYGRVAEAAYQPPLHLFADALDSLDSLDLLEPLDPLDPPHPLGSLDPLDPLGSPNPLDPRNPPPAAPAPNSRAAATAFRRRARARQSVLAALTPPDADILGPLLGLTPDVRFAEHTALPGMRTAGLAAQGSAADPLRSARALRRLLTVLAAEPLVLVLDDVHAADPESLEALDHLVRHPVAAPLLMVVAHRHRQAPLRLRSALAGGADRPGTERIALGPLSVVEAAELVGPLPAGRSLQSVYLESQGNPLYLLLSARGRAGAATAGPEGDGWLDGADRLEERILREVDGLTAREFTVAAAAAVMADRFDVDTLVAVSALDSAAVRAALPSLTRRDLLRPAAGHGGELTFRHPLVRRALYERVHPAWRVDAHRRALDLLAARGGDPRERARHVERCAAPWTRDDVDTLRSAAVAALRDSPVEAVHWLRRALGMLPAEAAGPARPAAPGPRAAAQPALELRYLLARALELTGRLTESRDLLQGLLAAVRGEPSDLGAAVVTLAARVERLLGRYPESEELLRELLTRTAAVTSAATAAAAGAGAVRDSGSGAGSDAGSGSGVRLGSGSVPGSDTASVRPTSGSVLGSSTASASLSGYGLDSDTASGSAPGSGHGDHQATRRAPLRAALEARAELVMTGLLAGRYPAVRQEADHAVRTAAQLGDRAAQARALALRALGEAYEGRTVPAGEYAADAGRLVAGLADAELTGDCEALYTLGCAELFLERFGEAERHLRRGELIAQRSARHYARSRVSLGRANVHLLTGAVGTAREHLVRAERSARRSGSADLVGLALGMHSLVALWELPPAPAEQRHVVMLEEAALEASARPGWWAGAARAFAADAALLGGDPHACLQALLRAGGGPGLPRLPMPVRPRLFESLTLAALATDDRTGAVAYVQRAERDAAELGLAGQRGCALRARAAVLAAGGEAGAAVAGYAEAAKSFASVGMELDQARAHFDAAVVLAAAARADDAAALFDRAGQLATRGGARRLAEQVARARAALTWKPPGAVRDPLAGLTAREREVAKLVGQGLTSRQTAERLQLSTRTVDSHLARIYHKLGIPSRSALARLIERSLRLVG